MSISQVVVIALVVVLIAIPLAYRLFGTRRVSEMDAKETEAARRLAKLLVAEIKLYEPYKLERGLRNNDILGSLADEIAVARKKFHWHFAKDRYANVFDEVLLSILADGDTSKLGAK